jgi:hypothetical protein
MGNSPFCGLYRTAAGNIRLNWTELGVKHDVHIASRDPVVGWKGVLHGWMDAHPAGRGSKTLRHDRRFAIEGGENG